MKNLRFYSILALLALLVLSACKKDDLTEDANPVLSLSESTLTVSAEGGVVSVDYQVTNPVDGSTVSVDLGNVTWITYDVTDSTIDLTVEANSESESRTATLTVSYPGADDVSLTVVQGQSPVLTLSETTLTVSGKGGVYSVDYQVENPVDGSTVSVDLGGATWITVDVTDSTIELTVEANSEDDSRTATLTVSYPGAEDVSLTVVQEIQYDYEYTLECFEGYLYHDYGYYLEDMFELWISDIGFDNDGYTQEGGHYYYFAILVEDVTGKNLPTGTYTYTSNLAGDMVFIEISKYLEQGSSSYTQSYLTDGYLNVSADGDIYTIEGVVTDTKGATHRIYYNGPAEIWSFALEDLEFTATTATASYYYDDGQVMNVELFLTDMEYDGYDINPPGSYVVLDTYMPYDADGKIAVGTYEVNYTEAAYSIFPYYFSQVYDFPTDDWSDFYTAYIVSGSMTVAAGSQDDYYEISCEFKTETDATVKCTYSGYLIVDGVSGFAASSSASTSQGKSSEVSKLNKLEMRAKSAEMKAAKESKVKVAYPASRTEAVSKILRMTK